MSAGLLLGVGIIGTLAAWNATLHLKSPFDWDASGIGPVDPATPGVLVSSSATPDTWLSPTDPQLPADVLDRLEFVHTPNAAAELTSFQMRLNDEAITAGGSVEVNLRASAVDGRIDGQDGPFPNFADRFSGRMWVQDANTSCTDSSTQEWRDLGEAETRVVVSPDVPQRTVCFGVMMSFDTGTSDSAQGHTGTGAFALTVEASKHD
ncbi:hypothetical protein ACL9RL_13155 [Plantibacter sp. Mn2098]|uniref:hypothetical protein n=1 Tax=Plantibacter sp. Mn2098 TaxID=3395266 RepID=UPI003BE5CBC7